MAKFATVTLSQLAASGRLDAGFHIALSEVRERVEHLAATVTPEEARDRLSGVALKDMQSLSVLARGNRGALNSVVVERIVEEYPHLSLAIVEGNLAPAIDRVRQEIASSEKALEALLALSPEAVGGPKP